MNIYGAGSIDHCYPDSNNNNSHHHYHHLPPPNSDHHHHDNFFSHFPSLHSDEAAELEWLSQFVDDTTSFFPDEIIHNPNNNENKKASSSMISHSQAPSTSSSTSSSGSLKSRSKRSDFNGEGEGGMVRRCSHCASEKTPQWRTGPLGPKTLCNACGVRFKSGRLVPEYRPAASPTFVLTQHSNSHRKVMELRRQKELLRQQQQQQHHDFKVC